MGVWERLERRIIGKQEKEGGRKRTKSMLAGAEKQVLKLRNKFDLNQYVSSHMTVFTYGPFSS